MSDADREFYCPPNTHVNIDKMRREANKDAGQGKTTIIHRHAAYDSCEEKEHEKYGFDGTGEEDE